jgi:hypothetical protein
LQKPNKNQKHNIMKRLSLVLIAVGACALIIQNAHATPIVSEGFNYTPGTYLGNDDGWGTGKASNLEIGSGPLTYSGYAGLTGNSLVVTSGTSTSDVNQYSAISSGSIYVSFLIECTTLPTGNEALLSLDPGTASPGQASTSTAGADGLTFYTGVLGTGYKIGVRVMSSGSGAVYDLTDFPSGLAVGTTYLVTGEYTFGAGSQVGNLYLDPVPGGLQPATPGATMSDNAASPAAIDNVGVKAQSATAQGDFIIDDIIVSTEWADVTQAVPEPSTIALAGLGMLGLVFARRMRR